ncbi:MAG TPA: hypothetical protein DCZ94_22850 [Lentisphaeria bacterium]|nr:MAG: hypothetical protein A2X48_14095 [Lentisphaerae bacterium GWF2_49_21]HBC89788.1 hypothetical protein [Lentisphaeria bacterium]
MDITKLDKNMAIKEPGKNLYWYDASKLTIEGEGWEDTESAYSRLPVKAKGIVREPVWDLGKCSAGISIHFSTDSSSLSVKWDGLNSMDHMTAVGVSGLDLYVRNGGQWKWLAVGRPTKKMNESQLFADLPSETRDFILYLPLYNPIGRIELGIPDPFKLQTAPPREKMPIVFYGTSITQGGCASRPGMCYTAILGRWLDNPVINLGFSGNGIMEPEVIDLLCELEPAIYVLDNMPNMEEKTINEREESAIRKLRNARPKTPIVLIDNMLYCDAFLKKDRMNRYFSSNKAQYAIFEKLIREGMKNLHYIRDDSLIGADGESTVDGTHFTDLGYMRFSEKLIKPLKKILEDSGI